ncbi:MAG: APC family permease [Gordonia sp. (in: high G+C Gram-positive bacteria)]
MPRPAERRLRGRLRLGARTELAGLDRRTLGLTDVVAQSVAVMAPCAAAATVPMLIGQIGGPLIWSVLTATVLAGLVAWTLGAFASRMAAPGALYTYAAKGLGPAAGLVAAAATVLGYGSLGMFALSQTAFYGLRVFGIDHPSPVIFCITTIGIGLCAATVLIRGIRISARIGLITEAIAVAVLLAVVVVVVIRSRTQLSVHGVIAAPGGWSDYLGGTAVATCGLIGFESAATLSVESKRPLRTIPRAIVWSLVVGCVVVLFATIAQSAGSVVLQAVSAIGEGDSGELARAIGVAWVAPVANLGVCASLLACALASTTALTRTLLSLAREGVIPARLGATHPRRKTPAVGVTATMTAMVVVIILAVAGGASESTIRGSMVSAPAIGFMASYALVCAAAPRFLRRTGEPQLGLTIIAIIAAAAATVILIVFVTTNIDTQWAPGVIGALAWFMLAAIGYGVLRSRRPGQLRRIGIHETPTRTEVFSGHLDPVAVTGGGIG